MKLPRKRLSKLVIWAWLLIAMAAIAGGVYWYQVVMADEAKVESAQVSRSTVESSQSALASQFTQLSEVPTRLAIDKISVDAPIEPVGLTADGLMDAPDSNQLVGWYRDSARAGEGKLAMLLDGHHGTEQVPAVFSELSKLELGDTIMVYGQEDSTLEYEVVETEQQYAEDVDMKKALYPYRDGLQSLTIITCEGKYDATNDTYDKRTIIYAKRIA